MPFLSGIIAHVYFKILDIPMIDDDDDDDICCIYKRSVSLFFSDIYESPKD